MVVVVKAAVAIEELDKVQQAPVDHSNDNSQVKLGEHFHSTATHSKHDVLCPTGSSDVHMWHGNV